MWTPDIESALFRGVCKFKPSGIHKHWQMINVNLFMNEVLNPSPVTIDQCWAKLGELYDLSGVEAIEDESREEIERDFKLSWEDFGDLMLEHAINPEPSEDEEEVVVPTTPVEDDNEEDAEGGVDDEEEDEEEEQGQGHLIDSRASSVDPDEDKRPRRQRRGTTPDDEPKGRRQSGRLARARSVPKSESKSEPKNEQKKRRTTSTVSTPKRRQQAVKKDETPAAKRRKRK